MPRLTLGFNDYGDLESRSDESNPAKIQIAGETWIWNYTKGYKAGYEAIHMIPQRPGVLECDRCEGRSAPSLYCWYVWIASLIHSVIAPTSRSIPNTAVFFRVTHNSLKRHQLAVLAPFAAHRRFDQP
jgi:hypothetical protein